MARPKLNVVRMQVTIPQEVFDMIELYLQDPIKGKLRYGALSKINTALWRQLLRELEKPGVDIGAVIRRYGVDIGGVGDMEEGAA